MPTLTVTKNYAANTTLTEAQLNSAFSSLETFLNTTKIDDDNIQANGITGASFATSVVDGSTLEINSNQLRIKDAGVTNAKLATQNNTTSSFVTQSSLTNTTFADVTGLSASRTVSGQRLVFVGLTSSTSSISAIKFQSTVAGSQAEIKFLRDSSDIAISKMANDNSGGTANLQLPTTSFYHIDNPGAGTFTWKVQNRVSNASTNISFVNCSLRVLEL